MEAVSVERLDHLGVVASVIKELGIIESKYSTNPLPLQRHLISRTLLVLTLVELIHLGSPLTFSDCCRIHVPRLWRG